MFTRLQDTRAIVFDLRGFATSVRRSFVWGRADAGWFAHGLAYERALSGPDGHSAHGI